MYTKSILAAIFATLALSSPIDTRTSASDTTTTKHHNAFSITDFVFGCTVTCDYNFLVTNPYSQLPGHPSFTTPVRCRGSLGVNTSFDPSTCESISPTQFLSAYIDRTTNELRLQYKVNVPGDGEDGEDSGATYWFEGEKTVGAATGHNPSPPQFQVEETKAYAIA